MKERTGDAAAPRRFQTVLLAAFAGIALLLALVGLYGLLAYMVRQRRAEIGIHMALGADRRRVIALVLRDGLAIAAAGLTIGLLAAAALAKWSSSLLYGVRPLDPVTFGIVPVLMVIVTAAACIVSAWHASRVDPLAALRH